MNKPSLSRNLHVETVAHPDVKRSVRRIYKGNVTIEVDLEKLLHWHAEVALMSVGKRSTSHGGAIVATARDVTVTEQPI